MDKRKKSCILIIILALAASAGIMAYRATCTASIDTESGWKMIFYQNNDSWYGILVCDRTSDGSVGTVDADVTIDGQEMGYITIKPADDYAGLIKRYLIGANKKYAYEICALGSKPKSAVALVSWDAKDTNGTATIEYK